MMTYQEAAEALQALERQCEEERERSAEMGKKSSNKNLREYWTANAKQAEGRAEALRLAVEALGRPQYCGECVKYCRADKCPTPGEATAWKTACEQFKGSDHG